MSLAAHDSKFRRWSGGVDRRICQTLAASPAEPGELPLVFSWYIGSSAVASSFGAAGALIVLLLWVYYSAQIFLLGAEFTKIFAEHHGSKQEVESP